MGIAAFLNSGWFTFLFYLGIGLLIYYNRDKFEFQAKFIAIYRSGIGTKTMNKWARKHPKLIKRLGYVGVFLGYLGMATIAFFIFKGLWDMVFQPEAPPVIAPVVPGVDVPGSPITIPLISGILSLFVVIVIHEFSHGLVSEAHDVPLEKKGSGFVMFGPIPGAFVEPKEDVLKEKSKKIQNSVFAAGPFSNMLTAGVVLLLFTFAVNPVVGGYFQEEGFVFTNVKEGLPADKAGVKEDVVYNMVNNQSVKSASGLVRLLDNVSVNETVLIGNEEEMHEIVTTVHPENANQSYIGVNIQTEFKNDDTFLGGIILWLYEFFNLVVILSLGLGLANLLPIGPVDGGRMYHLACTHFFGEEKGEEVWKHTSILFLAFILILLYPIFEAIMVKLWQFIAPALMFLV